jgi:CMP/dCMP kinase
MIVAIDGPAGAGKSTVARRLAERLGFRYVDTGAMYRALTWALLAQTVDVNDPAAVAKHADGPELTISTDPAHPGIAVDGLDVSGPIRGPEVTAAVSAVSAVPEVRARLVAMQREAVGAGGIVVEGRDIGSVVLPNATLKVFLTANAEIRSLRRAEELRAKGIGDAAADDTLRSIERRDRLDSTRAVSPLLRADDAVEIDATDLDLAQVVDRVVALVVERVTAQVGAP